MEHNVVVYATVTAMNALNMTSSSTSGPIKTDTTAPVAGTVVELSDAYNIIVNNDTATRLANIYICDNDDGKNINFCLTQNYIELNTPPIIASKL